MDAYLCDVVPVECVEVSPRVDGPVVELDPGGFLLQHNAVRLEKLAKPARNYPM